MYNESEKQLWISTQSPSTQQHSIGVCNAISEFETKLDKDIALCTRDEQIGILNSMQLTSPRNTQLMLQSIRSWCTYRLENGFPCSGLYKIDASEIDYVAGLKKTIFKTDSELVDALSTIIPNDQGYMAFPVFILLWYGFSIAEMVELKNDCLQNGAIVDEFGHSTLISNGSFQILKSFSDLNFTYRNRGDSKAMVFAQESDYFLKKFVTLRSKKASGKLTRADILSALKVVQNMVAKNDFEFKPLNVYNASLSGALYRLKSLEESGINIFDSQNEKLVTNAYKISNQYKAIVVQYKAYKQAIE